MKICGIVSEYNPFHFGHKLHIEKTRRMGASHIVAVMSGNTVQRGDIAVMDKHFRAKKACENGANLVVELPCPYSCASSENFARGAVKILKGMGCVDMLSFGCENDDLDALLKATDSTMGLCNSHRVKELCAKGLSYPTALTKACEEIYGNQTAHILKSPNNTLAIEYIKASEKIGFSAEFLPIKREGAGHDEEKAYGNIASASFIRNMAFSGEDFSKFLPYEINDEEMFCLEEMSKAVIFNLKTKTLEEILAIPDCTKELGVKLFKLLQKGENMTLAQLYDALKTKNITHARIRRVILYSILGVRAEDFKIRPYARILAFDDKGAEILAEVKKRGNIEISQSLSKLSAHNEGAKRLAQLDVISSQLQKMCGKLQKNYPNEFGVRFKKT